MFSLKVEQKNVSSLIYVIYLICRQVGDGTQRSHQGILQIPPYESITYNNRVFRTVENEVEVGLFKLLTCSQKRALLSN